MFDLLYDLAWNFLDESLNWRVGMKSLRKLDENSVWRIR